MKLTIAKHESWFAACEKEDKTEILVNRGDLPGDAKEGDVLVLGEDNIFMYYSQNITMAMPISALFASPGPLTSQPMTATVTGRPSLLTAFCTLAANRRNGSGLFVFGSRRWVRPHVGQEMKSGGSGSPQYLITGSLRNRHFSKLVTPYLHKTQNDQVYPVNSIGF
jgi:hypothetical protein